MSNINEGEIINGHSSKYRWDRAGVPQGIIFGPLLFNLYINDTVKVSQDAHLLINVHDTSLLCRGGKTLVIDKNVHWALSGVELIPMKTARAKQKQSFFPLEINA